MKNIKIFESKYFYAELEFGRDRNEEFVPARIIMLDNFGTYVTDWYINCDNTVAMCLKDLALLGTLTDIVLVEHLVDILGDNYDCISNFSMSGTKELINAYGEECLNFFGDAVLTYNGL